jgi:osmoprotectant transport system permease protein
VVGLSLFALGGLAVVSLPFLRVAPNRLVSGEAVSLLAVLRDLASPPGWLVAALLAGLAAVLLARPSRALHGVVAGLSVAALVGLLWLAGAQASFVAQTASPIARTSLGGAFWVMSLLLALLAADALQRLRVGLGLRTAWLVATLLLILGLLAGGWCDNLSIMKEYANRSDVFGQAMARHIEIVLVALLPTLLVGLPLGWLARRSAGGHGRVQGRAAAALFPVLNVIQTIPSIALFGLLMAPLALLAAAVPALARAGISGVGLAPGVVALTLYSLLPVVRGTLAGLEQVPSSVRDAARGLGMGDAQIFWRVDVPLAAPVVLAGMRTATVQMVGLAAVTALIGAGGLGAIMFEGLFSSAEDLVLLGVIPIVALGVVADAAFGALISVLRPKGVEPVDNALTAQQAA